MGQVAPLGPWSRILKLKLEIPELQMKSKKKKKVLGVFYGSFSSNFVEGGHSFFNFSKRGQIEKKSFWNHALEVLNTWMQVNYRRKKGIIFFNFYKSIKI